MANSFYNASGQPGDHAPGASAAIRSEYQAIEEAFDKMPVMSVAAAGFFVRVNISGTALESFNPAGTFVLTDGSATMTGTLKNTNASALRLVNSAGLIEGYNGTETTRTGYLQFNDAGSVLLRALTPAAAGIILQSNGGTLTLNQAGLTTLAVPNTAGALTDILRMTAAATGTAAARAVFGTTLLATNATIGGQTLTSTGGAFFIQTSQEGTGLLTTRMYFDQFGLIGVGRLPTSKAFEVQGGIVAGISDPEALRVINSAGYVSFWNSANAVRTGYLQGNAGTDVTLGADVGDLRFAAGGVFSAGFDSVGRVYFPRMHDNAAGALGTVPMVASGKYTPVCLNVVNAVSVTSFEVAWSRTGNVVTVGVYVTFGLSVGSNFTEIAIPLPIPSNISVANHLVGFAGSTAVVGNVNSAQIIGDVASDRARLVLYPGANTASATYSGLFTYLVE